MGGLELAESLEPRLRGLRPPAHAPVHHGDLERRAGLLLLAPERAGRELTLVERDEVLPHLVGREMIGEEAGGLRVARRDVEDALVGGGGAVGRLELLRERPREPQPAGDLLVLLGRLAGEALQRLGDVVPAAVVAKETLEEHLRAPVLRIEVQRVAEQRHDAIDGLPGRVARVAALPLAAPVAEDDLRGAHEERAAEGGVAGALGLVHVALEQFAPLRALGARALEGVGRVGVLRVGREQPPVGRRRPHVVHELFVEHAGQLREEPPFA